MLIAKRILILGSGGSGKTSFSRKLAAKMQIPAIHLDTLYWEPGWKEPDKTEWQNRVAELVQQKAWVMDGNYSGTLHLRLPPAEWIILLDMPNWRCIWNILKRRIEYAKSGSMTRPEMPPGCPETISLSFFNLGLALSPTQQAQGFKSHRTMEKPGSEGLGIQSLRSDGSVSDGYT